MSDNNKKIAIGSNIIKGPWGGGNQFALSLRDYLQKKRWKVLADLSEPGIDIILMTEPRITSATSRFNQLQIARYLLKNPMTIVVHRINECDERKNTDYVNKYLSRANRVADFTVFISRFLMELFLKQGYFKNKKYKYIRNGADESIFNRTGKQPWDGKSKIKIVTHHWAYNYFKGFDIYSKLNEIEKINGYDILFTYIGRLPDEVKLDNSDVIAPLYGEELAGELKKHHLYITASMNEPAGMHHIEGAMCGLPLLYRNSGALPEYCKDFGVIFDGIDDFEKALKELIDKYKNYFNNLKDYPYTSDFMCRNYEDLFIELLKKKSSMMTAKKRSGYLRIFLSEIFLQSRDIVYSKLKKVKKIKKVFNGKR